MDAEKIKMEARNLLDKFGKDLESIEIDSKNKKTHGPLRKEENGQSCDVSFKTIMFKNAPNKTDISLLTEKGHWD